MKKYIIELEEAKAETVVNFLAQINVKIGNCKPAEKTKRHIKIINDYNEETLLVSLTEEQFNFLVWIAEHTSFICWEEVNPDEIFEEI